MNPASAPIREKHSSPADEPTLVIGLGNPILGDDGVGWHVAEDVHSRLENSAIAQHVVIERLSVGGLGLMERMIGYGRAIVIDAISTGDQLEGSLSYFPLSVLPDYSAGHTTSAHDTSLQNALKIAEEMDFNVPKEIWIVAIEARRTNVFSDVLSPPIEDAVPRAADLVLALLHNGTRELKDDDLT